MEVKYYELNCGRKATEECEISWCDNIQEINH